MSAPRRNSISYEEAASVLIVTTVAAFLAVFSDASPTGTTATDLIIVAACAGVVTWLGASAPWWALMSAAGLVLLGALPGPFLWIAVATLAFTLSGWIGWERANQPIVRSVTAGAVVQVALRLEWEEFFLSSGIVAGVAMGIIAISGYLRRRRYVRRRIRLTAMAVGGLILVAIIGLGFAGAQAGSTARDGYRGLLDGLEYMQDGNVSEAEAALRQAANDLSEAENSLAGPASQLARFIPGIAQNRNTAVEVLADAAAASESAATTLRFVNLDQLTVDGGVIDVGALAALEEPLTDLEQTVRELSETLRESESSWLIAPLQSRLQTGIVRADQAAHQAEATAAAAQFGPELLGANGPRTYLFAFVNSAEARGTGGLMGNWSEVTIDNGAISVTANGRTADLQTNSLRSLRLDATAEYFLRYGPQGALIDEGVLEKYWSNVTLSPDMPSVGNAMAQMYETATGTAVDGVFIVDPAGIAALLAITGPVEVPGVEQQINSANAEQFLTVDQYEFAESDREDLLAAVTAETISNVLNSTLPPPQQMAPALASAVLNGHISGWAANPDGQELFELVGMDGGLPLITTAATDAIAVSSNNSSGNKIESFLERTIEYRPTANQRTGQVEATMKVSLTNTAPTTGYDDYVIGNIIGEPVGTNRMLLDIYTRLGVDSVTIDGNPAPVDTLRELGYSVYTTQFQIPSGGTVVVELNLSGEVGPGGYELVYRPQSLPRSDTLIVDAQTTSGDDIFSYEGTLERRSILSANGVRAWR